MALVIGTGIEIGSGITVSNEYTGPNQGTLVPWTSGTYFDSWTSQSGLTTTDLPSTNTAGGSSTYNTNNLVWQMFYAWQSITLPILSPGYGIATTVNNTNSTSLRYSQSSTDSIASNFIADVQIGSQGVTAYTAGGLYTAPITVAKTVPASRYFLLGVVAGPFYKSFKVLAANRTATVGGNPVVTAINKLWWGSWPSGPATGIPTQLGGSASGFTEFSGYIPVTSFKFTVP